jgi:hypothetical protein
MRQIELARRFDRKSTLPYQRYLLQEWVS